jgi:uncharacterized PurR-regulated membrane protein YhhQ (DUF165 family)
MTGRYKIQGGMVIFPCFFILPDIGAEIRGKGGK